MFDLVLAGTEDAKLLYAFGADSFGDIEYDHSGDALEVQASQMLSPVVLHLEDCPVEGEDSMFSRWCRWRTLCSAESMPTAKITLCISEIVHSGDHRGSHFHDNAEVWYVLEGRGVATLNGTRQKVSAGSVVYIPGGTKHKLERISEEPLRFVDILASDALGDVEYKFCLDPARSML